MCYTLFLGCLKAFSDSLASRHASKTLLKTLRQLNYLTITRLDISFLVSIVNQFLQSPCDSHWDAAVKPRENSNFLKKGKMVISEKIRNFSRSRMTKRASLLESSREI